MYINRVHIIISLVLNLLKNYLKPNKRRMAIVILPVWDW